MTLGGPAQHPVDQVLVRPEVRAHDDHLALDQDQIVGRLVGERRPPEELRPAPRVEEWVAVAIGRDLVDGPRSGRLPFLLDALGGSIGQADQVLDQFRELVSDSLLGAGDGSGVLFGFGLAAGSLARSTVFACHVRLSL